MLYDFHISFSLRCELLSRKSRWLRILCSHKLCFSKVADSRQYFNYKLGGGLSTIYQRQNLYELESVILVKEKNLIHKRKFTVVSKAI